MQDIGPYATFQIGCAIFLFAAESPPDPLVMKLGITFIGSAITEMQLAITAQRILELIDKNLEEGMMKYPQPTIALPTEEQVLEMLKDHVMDNTLQFEASDGCMIDADAVCEHNHPSWLRRYALI